jgi:hypothetical protein
MTNLVNTGKVRFLFKDLPADRASTLASEASYCAADQGKYWQYHDELYNSWQGENTGWVTKASLKQFAISISVKDINQFSQCLESGKYSAEVANNFNLAQRIGLNATPSFVLISNNAKQQPLEIEGAQPYEVSPTTNCNGVCVDTSVDTKNCGACGKACSSGQICSKGVCSLVCGAGQTNCNGVCVNTNTDTKNCGACGTACAAGQTCSMGVCSPT